ncbi:FecR protein [Algibacter lectus]|uniref:FecR family protein n=1 Tax=Algibacter lectus TaxID=221126 RepID=UPI0008EAE941|nr:FecR domain-containing protein [Algibacter lectus]SFB87831.1 FecR protein [Algibacter lectus]
MDKKEIQYLIKRTFDNSISELDKTRLNSWFLESVENQEKFIEYKQSLEKKDELKLSEVIDVELALSQTKNKIHKIKRKINKQSYLKYAVVFLPIFFVLGLSISCFFNNETVFSEVKDIVFKEVTSQYGSSTELVLPDGTLVWLNSGSTLRYPESFDSMQDRKVVLNGEAYFEVTKNKKKPFIVNTEKADVKVYGTSFNVSSYNDYESMSVALLEGKVSLVEGGNELTVLKPTDVVEFNSVENKLYKSVDLNINKYVAWKEGYMVFDDTSLGKVIERLEKWYNVKIQIEDNVLESYRFTATFHDESIENVLRLLCLSSPMEYEVLSLKSIRPESSHKIILKSKNK